MLALFWQSFNLLTEVNGLGFRYLNTPFTAWRLESLGFPLWFNCKSFILPMLLSYRSMALPSAHGVRSGALPKIINCFRLDPLDDGTL